MNGRALSTQSLFTGDSPGCSLNVSLGRSAMGATDYLHLAQLTVVRTLIDRNRKVNTAGLNFRTNGEHELSLLSR